MKKSTMILIVVLLGIGLFFWSRYGRAQNLEFEEIKVLNIDNEHTALSTLVKGPTIVHFYASWCGPCMAEIPHLLEYAKRDDNPYNVILITDDEPELVRRMILRGEGNVIVKRVESLKENDIFSIPVTYFTNNQSAVVKKILGECDWNNEGFLTEIKALPATEN
jgi:thiol-disulfide isomerase/thioredoxin